MKTSWLHPRPTATGLWVMAAVFVAVILSGTAWHLHSLRLEMLRAGSMHATLLARVLEDHATRTFGTLDSHLAQLAEISRQASAAKDLPVVIDNVLRYAPYIRGLHVTDADGRIVASSQAGATHIDISTLATTPLGQMYVAPPRDGRDWTANQPRPGWTFIPVSRRMTDDAGQTRYLLVALNPDYFTNQYQLTLHSQDDRSVLYRYQGQPLIGTTPQQQPSAALQKIMTTLDHREFGTFEDHYQDRAYLAAFRVSRHYPLVMVVGVSEDRIIATWWQHAQLATLMAIAGVLLTTLLTYLLVRGQRAREADQAELRAAHAALAESDKRWNFAIQGSGDGIWDWDINAGQVHYTPAWSTRFGMPSGPVSKDLREWAQHILPEDRSMVQQAFRAHLRGDTPSFQCEYRVICQDQSVIWLLDRGQVVSRDASGRPLRMIGTHSDLTWRHRLDQLKDEFVATVSHELRTPLTAIRGAMGLIAAGVAGPLSDQGKIMIDVALRNAERLLMLINDLLDIEKIEAGRMEFVFDLQPIVPIVCTAIEANQAYAERLGVHFRWVGGPLETEVRVDAHRLTQVLSNLLSNAAKFSPPGGTVEIGAERVGEQVRVYVCDHGPGIPENFRDKIFEKFSQADSSDTRAKGGTGLGLAISRKIVERMGGQMGFQSEPAVSTEFYFTLPLAESRS